MLNPRWSRSKCAKDALTTRQYSPRRTTASYERATASTGTRRACRCHAVARFDASSNAVTGCPRSSRRPPRAGSPPTRAALVCRGLPSVTQPAGSRERARLAARVAALPSRAPRNRTRAPPARGAPVAARAPRCGAAARPTRAPWLPRARTGVPRAHPQRRASATARAPAAKTSAGCAPRSVPRNLERRARPPRDHPKRERVGQARERGADAHPRRPPRRQRRRL